jgi:hypothetical protein
MDYDEYNREERSLCSHLFRLLHEKLEEPKASALHEFLGVLAGRVKGINLDSLQFTNIRIYAEVALIRDAYFARKSAPGNFVNELTEIVMKQESVSVCRSLFDLNPEIDAPNKTHPRQIRQKAKDLGVKLTQQEDQVYGAIQGMFNAKPDLVITIDNLLIVFEAKFTENFDDEQFRRTQNIAEVWSKLLYRDLGFENQPHLIAAKIGAAKCSPDISWDEIFEIQKRFFKMNDRSYTAFENGLKLLTSFSI